MKKKVACIGVLAIIVVMIISSIPSTIGDRGRMMTPPREPLSMNVFEIGTDVQHMPPERSGLFLPFMKYEIGAGSGSRGMFLYRESVLSNYGLGSAEKFTRISFMNMWGGEIYYHPDAGPQYVPGESDFLNFKIKMGLTTRADLNETYANNYDVAGPVTVYSLPGWHTIQGTHMTWMDFPLSVPFEYDGTNNLVIEYEWDDVTGYNMGINHGGSWDGTYANLYGNLMTGLFDVGYITISWSSYAKLDYGYLFGPPDEGHLPVLQIEIESTIPATVDVDPNTLNLKSKGKWITTYIELPEDYDVNDIDISTVRISKINGVALLKPIYAEEHPTEIGDNDGDGIPDLMVKFDRAALQEVIEEGDVEITITGELTNGQTFEGSDTIRVINKGIKGPKFITQLFSNKPSLKNYHGFQDLNAVSYCIPCILQSLTRRFSTSI